MPKLVNFNRKNQSLRYVRSLIVAFAAASVAHAQARSIYVSPSGRPTNDGYSPEHPLPTLERAEALAASTNAITTVYLMPGIYLRTKPLVIDSDGQLVTWRALRPDTVVLDGQGKTKTAIIIHGKNVIIQNLQIKNYTRNGILINFASHIKIVNNKIENISSTTWSSAAIHGLENSSNIIIDGNIINNTGYSGIQFNSTPSGDLSNLIIQNNTIRDTCKTKEDCGAIYVSGRYNYHTWRGRPVKPKDDAVTKTLIMGNKIHDFGPCENATKGIYLDDGMSDAVVQGNTISGRGAYAFQVHGGSRNLVKDNSVRVAGSFLLYQPNKWMPPMHGNQFIANHTNTLKIRRFGPRAPYLNRNITLRDSGPEPSSCAS